VLLGTDVQEIAFACEPTIAEALLEAGVAVATPCGGKGICGKCGAVASGALSPPTAREQALGTRLLCQTRLLGDACVTLPARQALTNIAGAGVRPPFALAPMAGRYGLAVDIGTTTLAATLVDLQTGGTLAAATAENPQRAIAADVIGRMEAALAGQSALLQTLVNDAAERLRAELCARAGIAPEAIDQAVFTGNTTMLYLLTGRSPEPLSHAPFAADCLFGLWTQPPAPRRYLPHCMGAFVGADITCAVLASQMCARAETAVLMDVGTNGEIALWHNGKLYVCATAAGPAFEGGGMECGCGSVAGAIDRVWAEGGALCCTTIDSVSPVGICGSGVIDAVAALLALGWLSETGAMEQERVTLSGGVVFTRRDVRNVQLAKSAIAAGLLTLCQRVGVAVADVAAVYLAGGFGQHIDVASAVAIGLLPQALAGKTRVIGNAALAGAEMLLLQTDFLLETQRCAQTAEVVTLSGSAVFAAHYMDCMMLEPF
jgi:uncharacterized 2Fe-2S/4Fe-4S cluster protein (DUF4445 family)